MKPKTFIIIGLSLILVAAGAAGAMAAGKPLSDIERLGMYIYKDKNISYYGNQSCQTCHHPLAGFADRSNFLHPDTKFVSVGSDGVSQGGRNAPTSAYAGYSPIRDYDESLGEWFGGMFWDGRATGATLLDPLAEQAQGPPTNPVEMAQPTKQAVIDVIMDSTYYELWKKVFDGPITDVDVAYDNFGRAIAAYERSSEVTKFSSKYDIAYGDFTDSELRGEVLFEANCALCHATDTDNDAQAALFTTYGYANIGVPANNLLLDIALIPDRGLGAQLEEQYGGDFSDQYGKFKIPTLRNVAVSAPYSHNGGFPTLYDMVSFINNSEGFTPDVNVNIDDNIGKIGLSDADVADIVAFLNTLTDDY